MYDIGTAVVGAGFIGPVHVEALRRLGVRVTGILGCDDNESQSAQAALGLPKAYASFDEVLADEAVDAVHLAVPNVLHYEMSKKALQAGKHVMCEKPLAMNSDRDRPNWSSWPSSRARWRRVCYNIRYYPLNLEARDMVARGDVGDVYAVNGSYVQDWLLYDTDYNWRVLAEQGGELRAVADIGTHWMDLVLSITGLEVEAVLADLNTVHTVRKRPTGEVETFTGKTGGQVEHRADRHHHRRLRLHPVPVHRRRPGQPARLAGHRRAGRTACATRSPARSARWPGTANRPTNCGSATATSRTRCLIRDPSLLSDTAAAASPTTPAATTKASPTPSSSASGRSTTPSPPATVAPTPCIPTFADGHREVVLCEAILKSHQQQAWVKSVGDVAHLNIHLQLAKEGDNHETRIRQCHPAGPVAGGGLPVCRRPRASTASS